MLLLWVSVVAASALAAPAPGAGGQRRGAVQAWPDAPNVVLVVSDSFDGRLTFYPGSQVVKLPFINFMKAHGTSFLNAYTNSPICCPSRAGTEMLNITGNSPTLKINRVEAWTRDVAFLLRQEGRPVVNLAPKKTKVRVMEADWKNTDRAVNWLRKEASNSTQPFVLYLGLNLPHPYPSPSSGENFGSSTFHTSLYWLKKVSYDAIKIPKWSPLSEMHPVDYYSSYTKNCTGTFTDKEIKNIRAFYYAMCAETDAMLGEIILALRQLGLLQKTIVIYTSDHGELAMEHRQFYKMSMYEASSHVPLLIMGPGIQVNLQVSSVVSLVDIYPTMLGKCSYMSDSLQWHFLCFLPYQTKCFQKPLCIYSILFWKLCKFPEIVDFFFYNLSLITNFKLSSQKNIKTRRHHFSFTHKVCKDSFKKPKSSCWKYAFSCSAAGSINWHRFPGGKCGIMFQIT
ncbi:hypothetical protein FD754_002149 [Muntiacus muntjak]|uniref:Sulfatase N-terminal domain-containing protein n=1 Tax=Muntiacus muntjak TaxID=9888 RepID=A0A5N3W959_MUNMU|nr:hypothetical protein FD754_002149 [Muntiacus muntjak]